MTRLTAIIAGVLLSVLTVCVTILMALGQDADPLIQFGMVAIIPTIASLYAGNRADSAAKSAAKAEHNTNGRLGDLIGIITEHGIAVDRDKYRDVWPERNKVD